jgi:hypothetical protein
MDPILFGYRILNLILLMLLTILGGGASLPIVYLKKQSYDTLLKLDKDPGKFVNEVVERALKEMNMK